MYVTGRALVTLPRRLTVRRVLGGWRGSCTSERRVCTSVPPSAFKLERSEREEENAKGVVERLWNFPEEV